MPNIPETMPHTLTIENRNRIFMSGASNVENFEDTGMNIETVMGILSLKGSDLHIIKFDTEAGELIIEGNIDCLEYIADTKKGGFLSRVFG